MHKPHECKLKEDTYTTVGGIKIMNINVEMIESRVKLVDSGMHLNKKVALFRPNRSNNELFSTFGNMFLILEGDLMKNP